MADTAVTFFVFQKKHVFIPLRSVYPECAYLLKDHPAVTPLSCFNTECPANKNCAEVLVRRLNYLFTMVVPTAELIVLYFTTPVKPKSIFGGLFLKDLDTLRVSTLNPYAFKKFKKEGIVYQWTPSSDFFLLGGDNTQLILPEQLIRDR